VSYLKENTRVATALDDEISAIIDAGGAKTKEQSLAKQLDSSGN
jgi:hypothetical protein